MDYVTQGAPSLLLFHFLLDYSIMRPLYGRLWKLETGIYMLDKATKLQEG